MRALENNLVVGTLPIKTSSFSINTIEDFSKAKKYLKNDKLFKKYRKKLSNKKNIIFDLDGVLIDSIKNMEKSWNLTNKNFV